MSPVMDWALYLITLAFKAESSGQSIFKESPLISSFFALFALEMTDFPRARSWDIAEQQSSDNLCIQNAMNW